MVEKGEIKGGEGGTLMGGGRERERKGVGGGGCGISVGRTNR